MSPPTSLFFNENAKRCQEYCAGGILFVCPYLYRAFKITFPLYIGVLFSDGNMKSEMGLGSIDPAIGVFIPALFNAEEQS